MRKEGKETKERRREREQEGDEGDEGKEGVDLSVGVGHYNSQESSLSPLLPVPFHTLILYLFRVLQAPAICLHSRELGW